MNEENSKTARAAATQVWRGIGVNDGLVSGQVRILHRRPPLEATLRAEGRGVESERERLRAACDRALAEMEALRCRAQSTAGEEEAGIFDIHAMFLTDGDWLDSLEAGIAEGLSAEAAVERTVEEFGEVLRGLSDPYLSARVADLKDVGARLIRLLSGTVGDGTAGGDTAADDTVADGAPYILVAEDLTPSETVMLDKSRILGFVTAAGTPHSHTAILARAMGIPALVGVGQVDTAADGQWGLLDAAAGTLTVAPNEEARATFLRRENEQKAKRARRAAEEDDRFRTPDGRPAVTKSGHRMRIYANIGGGGEVPTALAAGAEGIGLLRSEFLYLTLDRLPTEEELTAAYTDIARAMGERRVIIRTLDIGADKQVGYMNLGREENPALGFRGIRICLARQEMFKTQLRAILRASAVGRVAVMFPMIVSVDEVRACRALLDECRAELRDEGISFDPDMEVGIMIETPAAALMSRELSKEVDFFSVGTNDLTQYTLAADRQNPLVAPLCDANHEPVLRLVGMAAEAMHSAGGWIGICGELAADPALLPYWAALRIDELSASAPVLPWLRGRVTEME